jgi:uncharacterized protein (TIGR03437 family)
MAEPEIFRSPQEPHMAAALNQTGAINSQLNPAKLGSVVTLYATGFGPTNSGNQDGEVRFDTLPQLTLPVSVQPEFAYLTTEPIEVLYAGQAPGLVSGVIQINFRLPVVQTGDRLGFTVKAGDFTSGSFSLYVTE